MDEHHRKLALAFAIMVFVVSVFTVGFVMTDDETDAAATGSASSPLSSLRLSLDEFGFATPDSNGWPSDPVTTYYVRVGGTVLITSYDHGDGYGYGIASVSSGYGLSIPDYGVTVSGTITKAGTITFTACSYTSDGPAGNSYRASTIVAVDTDHVSDISIKASSTSGTISTGGTITLTATTTPTTADNRRVTWEI